MTTTLNDLLNHWTDLGITLWEDDGRLRYRAPRGVVTDDMLAKFRTHKTEILSRLRERTAPQPDAAGRYEPFPLTDVQGAYLMGRSDVFGYGGVACHLYCELEYPRLEPRRAVSAWHSLIDRHDMLRVHVDGSGFQQVQPEVPSLDIPIHTCALDGHTAQVAQTRARLSHAVHPVDAWPLFAIELTHSPDGPTTMHISFDFLVGDWASLLGLIAEWELEYADKHEPIEPPIQFRDYVLWERAQRQGERYSKDRQYWLDRIDSLPSAPQLPIRSHEPDTEAPTTAQWWGQTHRLPTPQWRNLERRARQRGLTATTVLLTCYADVLSRWAQDPHFCLNLTVLDRPAEYPHLSGVIGDFTTVSLLEVRADQRSFETRAREVMDQLFTDLDHRSFSGVEVMRKIGRRTGLDAALMPYVFTSAVGLRNRKATSTTEIHGAMRYTISQTPQAFLDCQVMDDTDGLHVHWDARVGTVPQEILTDMFTAFTNAIAALADDDNAWSSSSPVELPARQQAERDRANATERVLPTGLLHESMMRTARATPDAPAVLGPGVHLTYGQLLRRARTVCAALHRHGVRAGDRVAIGVPRSPEQIAAVIGTLLAGAAYVPLDLRQPPARLSAICADAEVAAVLHSGAFQIPVTAQSIDVTGMDEFQSSAALSNERVVDPADHAYIIYTSGSTGRPKGVVLSHRAVMNTVMDVNARLALTPRDRTLAVADLGFDLSVYDIFGPLSIGGAVVLPPADTIITPSTWLETASEHGVTVLNTVPAIAQLLLTAHDNDGPVPQRIRKWILSGDRIPRELVHRLHKTFPHTDLIAMGGATEAAIWSIAHDIARDEPDTDIPYGRPLANQRFAVLDALGRDAPTGVAGELVIMGTGLADGYCNAPEQTRRSFVDHPRHGRTYRTGDRGHYLPGGEIAILGRNDDQIKIRGHRIELGEVEAVLTGHPSIEQAAVVAAGDDAARALHAYLIPADSTEEDRLDQWVKDAAVDASGSVSVGESSSISAYADALESACKATLTNVLAQVRAGLPVAASNNWIVEAWTSALDDATPSFVEPDELEALWDRVGRLSPEGFDYQQFTDYVRASADRLPELLSGAVPAHEVLFPGGSQAVAERIYQDRASMRWGNAAVTSLVSRIAARHDRSAPLRVLEIGAGTGSTTRHIAAGLRDVDFRYDFTDRSEYFLPAARTRWGDDPRWSFDVLDIDDDPTAQGYDQNGYDIVCAFGVLENARDIPEALRRMTRLARDEGAILLSEPVDHQWWVYVSQIFLMTQPAPGSRQNHELFPPAQWWAAQLRGAAGGPVAMLPEADHALAAEKFAFFATSLSAAESSPRRESVARFLADRLPAVMVPHELEYTAELPLTRNGKVDKGALSAIAAQRTATGRRTPIDAVAAAAPHVAHEDPMSGSLARLWAEQLGLDSAPSADENPFDIGANSITAAAVAGRLRDEFNELSHTSFETVLRTLLTATSIRSSIQELTRLSQPAPVPAEGPSARAAAVLEPMCRRAGKSRRTTLVFTDALTDTISATRLAAAMPDGAGTVLGVTVPDDDWFLGQPAETIADTIANLVVTQLDGLGSEEYALIGYSFGALVAIETARRLIEDGKTLLPLGLIDPHIIPDLDDDRVSEIMYLTSRGARMRAITGDETTPLTLDDVLRTIAGQSNPESQQLVESLLQQLTSLDESARWHRYAEALGELSAGTTPDLLHQGWLRYRHTMRAATVQPDPLVSDAVIVQPLNTHGFLPDAHAEARRAWEETFIGQIETKQVPGDHFTVLSAEHASATTAALLEGLDDLGATPPPR